MAETLRMLSAQAGVKLVADGVELGLTNLACAYDDAPLRDVLDSLGHVRNYTVQGARLYRLRRVFCMDMGRPQK